MHDHHSQQMNDGLLLFRNILHIPNGGEKRSTPIMTNYLLKHGLGRIITYLLKQSNKVRDMYQAKFNPYAAGN